MVGLRSCYSRHSGLALLLLFWGVVSCGEDGESGGSGALGGTIVLGSNLNGSDQIYIMDADGQNRAQLTNHSGGLAEPDWSPDGKQIVSSGFYRPSRQDLYIMNSDGSDERRIAIDEDESTDTAPAWSPNGTRIAFASSIGFDAPGQNIVQTQIYTVDPSGENLVLVTQAPQDAVSFRDSPDWSPTGDRLIFSSCDCPSPQFSTTACARDCTLTQNARDIDLFLIEASGGPLTQLTADRGRNIQPAWSQASGRIAFASDRNGVAQDLTLHAGLVYAAYGYAGLRVIDASDPAQPLLSTTLATPGSALGLAVSGDFLYLAADDAGLRVIDISSPAEPAEVGSVDTPGVAQKVAVSGELVYVADGAQGVRIIDVADKSAPVEIGAIATPDTAYDVAVVGDRAYLAADLLYVIDVSDPTSPVALGSVDTPGVARAVAVAGEFAYLAASDFGLRIVDVSDPAAPSLVGGLNRPNVSWSVQVLGDLVYMANDTNGIRVIDVSDRTDPVQVGSEPTAGQALDVEVMDGVAYVATGTAGLSVMDVTDSTDPQLLGSLFSTYQLYLMNDDGGDVFQLTRGVGPNFSPVWSPDGSRILFSSRRTGHDEIYGIDPDGRNEARVTYSENGTDSTGASWRRVGD